MSDRSPTVNSQAIAEATRQAETLITKLKQIEMAASAANSAVAAVAGARPKPTMH